MKFKIGKIRVGLEFPFFALAAYFLSGDMWKNFLYAVVFSLLHEAGHILSISLSGCGIKEISTDITGIRIIKNDTGMSYISECFTALAGPFVNLLFATVFVFLKNLYPVFRLPFDINCGLFLVNMLPVRSLDGGRFLNNLLLIFFSEDKARMISVLTEISVAVLLVVVLIITLVFDVVNTSFVFFVLTLEFMIVSQLLKS